jgi:hypothetical protein
MDHPRGDLLAGTRGAGDQHPRSGRRDALDLRAHGDDRLALAMQGGLRAGAQAQLRVLARQPRRLERAPDHDQQPVGLERLFDEVVGALLQRRDRGLDRAVTGDHHRRHRGLLALHRLEDAQPVESGALQPYIQDHQRRPPGAERGDRLVGIGGETGLESLVAQNALEQQPDIRLVVDDQDLMRHRTISHRMA